MNRSRGVFYRPFFCAAALILFLFGGAISYSALPPGDDEHGHDDEHEGRLCRHKAEDVGDPSQPGMHHVATASYNLPNTITITATENGSTTTDTNVHLWAVVYYPGISSGASLSLRADTLWWSIFTAIMAFGLIPAAITRAARPRPTRSLITKGTTTFWSGLQATASSPSPSTPTT